MAFHFFEILDKNVDSGSLEPWRYEMEAWSPIFSVLDPWTPVLLGPEPQTPLGPDN